MTHSETMIAELSVTVTFFKTSTSCLSDDDSGFAPAEGMMTVAHHIAHTAHSIDWFVDPLITGKGFDLDFDAMAKKEKEAKTVTDAMAWLDRAVANAVKVLADKDDAFLVSALPEGPIMSGLPRMAIMGGIVDHTAHHRGALTVYSRLLKKTPVMPYEPQA